MTEIYLTIFFISLLLFLLGSGIWVALSMIAVSAVGMLLFTTRPVGDAMATTIWGTSSSWTLTALPLFVWMGEILFRTKLSENLFKGLSPWLSKLPGGLVHVNVVGCALFAAISGSSAATVATVGKMSIPELRKRKYPEKLLLGTLAGSGTLGLLIPPSIILIIYGVTIEDSIAKLFMAGILPGIMIALMFMFYVIFWSILNKKLMPKSVESFSLLEKIQGSKQLLPVILLITSVIGSIYTLLIIIGLTNNSFSAGSGGDSDSTPKTSDYAKAKNLINAAKKYEKKGKIDKAQKRYAKAQKLLLKSNKKKPLQADTLNYLGFTTRKLGDYEGGEKFYLQGLQIEPNHNGINEYLGELYVATNRMDMAKERLEILKTCNCEEFDELKEIIEGTKKSKY